MAGLFIGQGLITGNTAAAAAAAALEEADLIGVIYHYDGLASRTMRITEIWTNSNGRKSR